MKNRFERITVVDWNGGGDFCGNSGTADTPQERSDEEDWHPPAKRVPRNGNQRFPIVVNSILDKKDCRQTQISLSLSTV